MSSAYVYDRKSDSVNCNNSFVQRVYCRDPRNMVDWWRMRLFQ